MKKDIRTLAALLIASATFVACSNDNEITEQPPSFNGKYTMTINATKSDDEAMTRALSLSGSTLNATWATTENVYVGIQSGYKQYTWATGSMQPQEAGTNTTLKGTFSFSGNTIQAGISLRLQFPKGGDITYDGQLGTLADIAANFDYANATVRVASVSEDGNITLDNENSVSFTNQQAIVKFTLKQADGSALNPTAFSFGYGSESSIISLSDIPDATYTTNGDGVLLFWRFLASQRKQSH